MFDELNEIHNVCDFRKRKVYETSFNIVSNGKPHFETPQVISLMYRAVKIETACSLKFARADVNLRSSTPP